MDQQNDNCTAAVDDVSRLYDEVKKIEADLQTLKGMLNDASSCKMEVTRSALAKVCTAYYNKMFKSTNG